MIYYFGFRNERKNYCSNEVCDAEIGAILTLFSIMFTFYRIFCLFIRIILASIASRLHDYYFDLFAGSILVEY